ncbi:hypothetical protein AZE42_09050 [Rhizopogon vesiculosus]|uniref:C2H2-type domain-containing protein n=1 Tax=Rhizopogon vesiculosus TaxID=180088 RepID=A0A1J8QP92_9AGAM|nr:hypothetical protein AZE42_09050 [Rhizopogon vesiculosus]
MTELDRMLHDDFPSSDSTEFWMAPDNTFAPYPGYSTMYDATILGYQSDFDTTSHSSSPSLFPSFSDHYAGARGREHAYAVDGSAPHLFSGGRFNRDPFGALGVMRVNRLPPQLIMEQPRTVHMSDVIVPNTPSPIMHQPRSDSLVSLSSPSILRAARRNIRGIRTTDDGESEVDSEGDSYCPSEASGPHADHLSAVPTPSPVRRRRRQDINLPIPVPNLTKKSRGRKVPTSSGEPVFALSKDKSKKGARTYTCHVDGCGKCFVRSEHLKRHIRSIHTNDKPWVCSVWGCERSFSRRDNLNQHMRIHKSPSD